MYLVELFNEKLIFVYIWDEREYQTSTNYLYTNQFMNFKLFFLVEWIWNLYTNQLYEFWNDIYFSM